MKKIILSLFLALFGVVYFLYQPNKNSIEKVYDLVSNGHLYSAEKMLSKLENKTTIWGYKGFIELIKNDPINAEVFFQKALLYPQKKEVLQEIYLGKALIHYLNHDLENMQHWIEKAKTLHIHSRSLSLLEGLYSYETGDLKIAFDGFSSYLGNDQKLGWLEPALINHFPLDLVEIYCAHTLAYLNKLEDSRTILEKRCFGNYEREAHLFLGYTYLKEAENVEFPHKSSYLDVAICYLERGDCSLNEKIAPEIVKTLEDLLKNEEDCFYAFSFIHLLEKWKFKKYLIFSAEKVIKKIEDSSQFAALSFCNSLKEGFEGKMFHQILLERMILSFQKNIKDKKVKNPFDIWHKIEALSRAVPEFAHNQIASFTEQEILTLLQEEKNLNKSLCFLKFWKTLEREREARHGFAEKLLKLGMLYWRKENEEQKGTQVLKIALHIADDNGKKGFLKEIEDFFLALYNQAQGSNIVSRLSLIYDAMKEFKIPFKGLLSKDELANHLADAAYYYSVHNFYSSKLHAEWVLKIDPKNQPALRLVGLSSFHLGNYKLAWCCLSKLKAPDSEAKEACMLSERHFSDEPLVQVDLLDTFKTEE